jgi:hypothetical protein
VPGDQNFWGRQSTRRLLNQCQAPRTGAEVLTFSCCSTAARAEEATGLVKTIDIGIATPTVLPVAGVIESNWSGGPAGRVGVGLLLGLTLVPAAGPLLAAEPPPPPPL